MLCVVAVELMQYPTSSFCFPAPKVTIEFPQIAKTFDSVRMMCEWGIGMSGYKRVLWYFTSETSSSSFFIFLGNDTVTQYKGPMVDHKRALHIDQKSHISNHSILLRNISAKDAGDYMCSIEMSDCIFKSEQKELRIYG